MRADRTSIYLSTGDITKASNPIVECATQNNPGAASEDNSMSLP